MITINFANILSQVLVLFILILIGCIARIKNLLDENSTSTLSSLIMNLFLPAMIIDSMQINYNPDMVNKIFNLLIISIIMYLLCFVFAYLYKFIFKVSKDIGIYQYVIMFSNVGFMGYPVIEAVLGKEAVFYTAIFNLPFNLLIITLGSYFLSKDVNDNRSFSFNKLLNPVIISILIGLILFLSKITLPVFIKQPISMLGNITTSLSMILIGSILCSSFSIECFYNKNLYIISFIRLILIPIFIYLILKIQVKDSLLLFIPVVISSMPAAANTAIMANEYGCNSALASQIIFITTLFSVITIPFISMLIIY